MMDQGRAPLLTGAEENRRSSLLHALPGGELIFELPAAMYVCDAEGVLTFFNAAAAELWGCQPEIGRERWTGSLRMYRGDGTLIAADDGPMARSLRERQAVHGEEVQIERPDGSRRYVRVHPTPIFDIEHRLVGGYNLLLDVTENIESDRLRSRLAAIVQSSDDAIVSKDLNGIVQSWNSGAERLFGYTAEEMIGQSITKLIPQDRINEEPSVLKRIRAGETVDHYETMRLRKDGSVVDISLTISPITDSQGCIIGASKIARDITQRRRTEEQVREADRRKDEFLATLAHELRNPLAPLTTSLDILRLTEFGDSMPRRVVEVMDRQVHHLVRLVDDLLEVSRITRGKIDLKHEPLALAEALKEAIEISRPLIESHGHRLEVSAPAGALLVTGDRTRLVQVIANLLNNAAKFTVQTGLIRVVLERQADDAVLRVIDNGIGIAREMQGRVFDMFTQVRASQEHSGGGLGIGLALVKRLMELQGGTVEVRSDGRNTGSEFILRLPLQAEAALQEELPGRTSMAAATRRVLVVDDNRDAAESLALLLRTLGHQVHLAHDGVEALRLAEGLRPEVLLLDLGMPGMSGYEVARQLRAQAWGRNLSIIAVTGWGQEGDRSRSSECGFDHHLVKPVNFATLDQLMARPPRSSLH